jgi:ankyrin repeat protein
VENCDLFYVEKMLQHGANPNLKIKNPQPENYFQNGLPLLVAIGNRYNGGKECLDLIKLLVDNGADINSCYQQSYSDLCEGVITQSLTSNSMETLKYFVIEKKIIIPDTVVILGEMDRSTQEVYGLKEILNSKDYKYENFERDGKKYDRSRLRKTRDEILEYLKNSGK